MINELYEKVVLFNELAGQPQKFDAQTEVFWQWVEKQANLIKEELQETLDAIANRDLVEVLDGTLDVFVTNSGLMDILSKAKISVMVAGNDVCNNNLSKMTQNPALAKKTVEEYDAQHVPCYVERKIVMDGIYPREWYTVRRVEDGKIMKPYGYQRVSLGKYVDGGSE